MKRTLITLVTFVAVCLAVPSLAQDKTVKKIIEIGTTDNRGPSCRFFRPDPCRSLGEGAV